MKAVVLLLMILFANVSFAQSLPGPLDIIDLVDNSDFKFVGKAKLKKFFSTQSCVFRSDDILFIRNYCNDNKFYPAKSYYVLSPRFGFYYFYEEDRGFIQREVTLNNFPEAVATYWNGVDDLDFYEVDKLLEYLYYDEGGACWVTNYSPYKKGPHSDCHRADITKFPQWKKNSEDFVFNEILWDLGLERLLAVARR